VPKFWPAEITREQAAGLVSLSASAIHPSLPIVNGGAGVDYLYVPVGTRADVAAARANPAAMDDYFGEAFHRAVYVFAVEPDANSDVRGRMFFLVNGAPLEDPDAGRAGRVSHPTYWAHETHPT